MDLSRDDQINDPQAPLYMCFRDLKRAAKQRLKEKVELQGMKRRVERSARPIDYQSILCQKRGQPE
jgi:hypothetical protein